MVFKYVTNIRICVRGYLLTGIRIRGASSAGIRIRIRIRGYANFDIRFISNIYVCHFGKFVATVGNFTYCPPLQQ